LLSIPTPFCMRAVMNSEDHLELVVMLDVPTFSA
jgi:hypothetical protein